MQEITNTLKKEKEILINYNNNFKNLKGPYKKIQDCINFLEQNISPGILNIVKEYYVPNYSNSSIINNIIKLQIIKNIGIDEYNNIYLKNNNIEEQNEQNCFSYINEVKKDAFNDFINRFFSNIINFIKNEECTYEEAINKALILEYREIEVNNEGAILLLKKDPKKRINELLEMTLRQKENDIYYYNNLFKAYQFNMSKIFNISYNDLENPKMEYIKEVFKINFRIRKNLPIKDNTLLNDIQKQTIKKILNQRGEDTSSIYINCIKPFLSTYFNESEDPIQNFCLAIDNCARNAMPISNTEEDSFKRKINNYMKNMDIDDLNMLKAILTISEVKQALNDKSYGVVFPDKIGDLLIKQINQIKNSKISIF